MMKRMIAMGLACAVLMTAPVMAETADSGTAAETEKVAIAYEGEWTLIEGAPRHNFELYLPTGWTEYDLTEDEADETAETAAETEATAAEDAVMEEGLYFSAGSGDGAQALDVYWETVEEASDAAAMQAQLTETHADAAVVNIGNVEFVQYTDGKDDAIVLVLPLENDVYTFRFMPASDEEYAQLANEMIATIVVYDAQTGDMLGAEPEVAEEAVTEGDA